MRAHISNTALKKNILHETLFPPTILPSSLDIFALLNISGILLTLGILRIFYNHTYILQILLILHIYYNILWYTTGNLHFAFSMRAHISNIVFKMNILHEILFLQIIFLSSLDIFVLFIYLIY
jgi:hypothetical protein